MYACQDYIPLKSEKELGFVRINSNDTLTPTSGDGNGEEMKWTAVFGKLLDCDVVTSRIRVSNHCSAKHIIESDHHHLCNISFHDGCNVNL